MTIIKSPPQLTFKNEFEVYSTVPSKNIQAKDWSEEKTMLLNTLRNRPGVFFPAKMLAIECGFPDNGTQVELRKAATELLEIDMLPIVSTSSGFAWATCANMVKRYGESLRQRSSGLDRRIEAVDEIYFKMLREEKSREDLGRFR